ncbi:hypothetical protein I4F81_008199 [Pyropia yezoensis]|uniref:Uncharacterized protein n=1 Tax=Pyropia yezoensis TaxID=2788 RepID=A0ACC3C6R0_PYRYE|nr:hypothetical protein I4F81_008199 [Neopyropia yezoensis]
MGGGGALRWVPWGAATPCRCAPPRNGHGEPPASNPHPPPLRLWPVTSGHGATAPACGGGGGGGGRWRAARPSAAADGGRRPRRSARAAATPRWPWRGGVRHDGRASGRSLCLGGRGRPSSAGGTPPAAARCACRPRASGVGEVQGTSTAVALAAGRRPAAGATALAAGGAPAEVEGRFVAGGAG